MPQTITFLLALLGACAPLEIIEGDTALPIVDHTVEETGGADQGRAAWITIQTGYCSFHTSADGGASWSESEYVNVANSSQAVTLYGAVDELIEVFCDASIVPQYDPPSAVIDPQAAPVVYCNPWGDSNKIGGEADDCGEDLWVYIYSSVEDYADANNLGPYNLN